MNVVIFIDCTICTSRYILGVQSPENLTSFSHRNFGRYCFQVEPTGLSINIIGDEILSVSIYRELQTIPQVPV